MTPRPALRGAALLICLFKTRRYPLEMLLLFQGVAGRGGKGAGGSSLALQGKNTAHM